MSSTDPLKPAPTPSSTLTQTQPSPSSPSPSPSSTSIPNTFRGGTKEFLPSGPLSNRFLNFYRMVVGSMSPQGQVDYWADADIRFEGSDCNRCEEQRDYLLKYSPVINYLSSNIEKLGGKLDKTNIRCRRCEPFERMQGGFDPTYGIKLCANVIQERSMMEDTIAHEMVHAWDYLRWKVNWEPGVGDLRTVACTEIRASSLSGECRWSREFFANKFYKLTNHHQDCVRRRATLSVSSRPQCPSDLHAAKAVNEVWESCFRDTRPFDEIYR